MTHEYKPCTHVGRHGYGDIEFCDTCRQVRGARGAHPQVTRECPGWQRPAHSVDHVDDPAVWPIGKKLCGSCYEQYVSDWKSSHAYFPYAGRHDPDLM